MKNILKALIYCMVLHTAAAQQEYNYANGNGTILEEYIENGFQITIRKHEQRILMNETCYEHVNFDSGYYVYKTSVYVYEAPNKNSELFGLDLGDDDHHFDIIQMAVVKDLSSTALSAWVKIKDKNNRAGWIDIGWDTINNYWELYNNGTWAILENIKINGRNWTARKCFGKIYVYDILNVRNSPGVNGTNVLFQLIPTAIMSGDFRMRKVVSAAIIAITEEKDTINGRTDRWIKIEDEHNRIGWIFGGYAYHLPPTHEGGAHGIPKYRIPEEVIETFFEEGISRYRIREEVIETFFWGK